jgi:hypothetical protein
MLKSVSTSVFLYLSAGKISQAKKIVKFVYRNLTIRLRRLAARVYC